MHDLDVGAQRGARILVSLRDVLVADALTRLLGEAGFRATACCGDLQMLLEQTVTSRPDATVVEPGLEPGGLSPCLSGLREALPEMCIVVVVREVDAPLAHALIRYSVNGVISLATQFGAAVCILRQTLDGKVVYPRGVLEHLSGAREPELLSERQREILQQVALGHSNDQIAERLFISRNTVKFHLREIYARLGVRNRFEALQVARAALAGESEPPNSVSA